MSEKEYKNRPRRPRLLMPPLPMQRLLPQSKRPRLDLQAMHGIKKTAMQKAA
jgi:hypothetical protein